MKNGYNPSIMDTAGGEDYILKEETHSRDEFMELIGRNYL